MRIPKQLKIGAHTYKVIQKKIDKNCGETDFHKGTITIDTELSESMKGSTLFHEILCHCINTTFTGEAHIAHAFMDSISEQMYAVLSENKLLK